MRNLFLDLETTSLDPLVANILEIAYIPIVDGVRHETRFFKVQPIPHELDYVHGKIALPTFIQDYNSKLADKRFELEGGSLDGGNCPLFQYAKSVLTFDTSVAPKDPKLWLMDVDRLFPDQVFEILFNDLNELPGYGRWQLVGYNTQYDYNVLTNWIKRVVEAPKAQRLLNCINYNFLDVLALVKWFTHAEKMRLVNHQLRTVADALQIDFDAHTAKGDIEATYSIAKILLGALNDIDKNSSITSS